MEPITLEEAIPVFNTQLRSLEELVFKMNTEKSPDFTRHPDLLDDYRGALVHRCNFTKETLDLIKDLQLTYPNSDELNEVFIRYSDCYRQLLGFYNRL